MGRGEVGRYDGEGRNSQSSIPLFVPVYYRVFIKYCVFSEDFKIFLTLAFLCFPSLPVCVHKPGR